MRIRLEDLEIEYEQSGAGAPMVLVHGGGLDLETWEEMTPLLERSFTVYRFDMRGFGKTTRLSDRPLSMAVWASDLKLFLDALHIQQPILVGWSLGGAVIMQFAANNPAAPRGLVLMGAPGQTAVGAGRAGFDTRQQLIREGYSPDEVIERTFDFTKSAFSLWSREHNPHAVEMIKAGLKRNFSSSYAEMVEAVRLRVLTDEMLGAIECPALILVGDEDARTPVAMSEELNIGIRRSYMKILRNCGHYYGYEYPKLCSEITLEFSTFI